MKCHTGSFITVKLLKPLLLRLSLFICVHQCSSKEIELISYILIFNIRVCHYTEMSIVFHVEITAVIF